MLNSFWWCSKPTRGRSINWLSWDKVCLKKDDGGLSFRSFHCFNLAMLGKHGWHFIADPDALISQFFKFKYFPNGDFLTTVMGSTPSCIWRGICCSQVENW